jgi:transposase
MVAALGLRNDFDAAHLRAIAKQSKEAAQTRRLLALAAIYEGASRTEAAKIGGVTVQIIRDWVVRFNAHGPEGLVNRKAPGQQARLKGEHRTALARIVESGPDLALHGVVRWRLIDLCRWALAELKIAIAPQTMSRELRKMGFRKLSARPRHHEQAEGAIEDFKKVFPRSWKLSRRRRGSIPTT